MPDWVVQSDECKGAKQVSTGVNVYCFLSKTNYVNYNLEIPNGFRLLSWNEYNNLIPVKTEEYAYFGHCGHVALNDRRVFFFSDSQSVTSTQHMSSHEGKTDKYAWTYLNTHFSGYVLSKINN